MHRIQTLVHACHYKCFCISDLNLEILILTSTYNQHMTNRLQFLLLKSLLLT